MRNTADNVLLVGSSPDLPSMLNRQRFQLDLGGHPHKKLQQDWTRLGSQAFSFEVLDRLETPEGPAEPERDLRNDLATLLDMWRAKLTAEGQALYTDHPRGQ